MLAGLLAEELTAWPGAAGVAVLDADGVVASAGDLTTPCRWASVTKILAALTTLLAADAGLLDLDEPAGPPGATVRHLLAHASGVAFDEDRIVAAPGRRRIYSNRGIELLADRVAARAGRPFAELLAETVLTPLGMTGTVLHGSPAHGCQGPVGDLALLARELLAPRRLPAHLVRATATTTFPGLAGILPGFGRQDPNDWGLGLEIRGTKSPHWTAPTASPATFGHFGQSGSFLWVDPEAATACVSAGETPFGPWATTAWPQLAGLVLARRHASD
ncbi:serine hydrolase domain-containing protein [Nocardioides sp.]|uniref:serine hydrolase domain-containing protein n=1 Tax=Nocardioides sp. TaxID=35761 RepID=UPI0039E500DB